MPELPEVETMRRGILSIIGSKICRVARTPCRKKAIEIQPRIDHLNRKVRGQKILSVDRLGKRVVLRLEDEGRLIFEPRMTGIVLIGIPPNEEHLRFEIQLDGTSADRLLFWDRRGLGKIRLYSKQEYEMKLSNGSLGPDALTVTAEEFRSRGKTSRREIKVALLDQKFIAGVGNLYAAEILFLAGVDPRMRCCRLKSSQWNAIHQSMVKVLNLAIRYEGSTLSDGTYQKALNDPGSYQNQHRVYDREDLPCPLCGKKITRIVQAQRSTFFCNHCQKR